MILLLHAIWMNAVAAKIPSWSEACRIGLASHVPSLHILMRLSNNCYIFFLLGNTCCSLPTYHIPPDVQRPTSQLNTSYSPSQMQRLAPSCEYGKPERGGTRSLSLAAIREIYIGLGLFYLNWNRQLDLAMRNTSDLPDKLVVWFLFGNGRWNCE